MKAPERLYLDSTKTKVLREGDKGKAYLLSAKDLEIDPRYVGLVQKFYGEQDANPPESPPTNKADPVENLENRVPTGLVKRTKRGRKPKDD